MIEREKYQGGDMDTKDFTILKVLGETGSITRAAELLFMTQPALSKRIKLMEAEFGRELLIRSHQGIHFTPAGEKVLQFSKGAALAMDKLKQELDLSKGEICGTLRAGYSLSYGTYRLAGQLAEYYRSYPKVNLQIIMDQSGQLYQQMLDGALDIAIIRGEYTWERGRYLLAEEKVYMVCSRENQDRKLEEYPYISRETDPYLSGQLLRWLREKEISTESSRICVDNITTCEELVESGVGLAILPEIALENFSGVKKPLAFKNGEPFIRRTYVFCQREALKLPQVDAFIKVIRKMHI